MCIIIPSEYILHKPGDRLLAVQILATSNETLLERMIAYKQRLAEKSRTKNDNLNVE